VSLPAATHRPAAARRNAGRRRAGWSFLASACLLLGLLGCGDAPAEDPRVVAALAGLEAQHGELARLSALPDDLPAGCDAMLRVDDVLVGLDGPEVPTPILAVRRDGRLVCQDLSELVAAAALDLADELAMGIQDEGDVLPVWLAYRSSATSGDDGSFPNGGSADVDEHAAPWSLGPLPEASRRARSGAPTEPEDADRGGERGQNDDEDPLNGRSETGSGAPPGDGQNEGDPFPQPSDTNPRGGDPFPQPSDTNPTGGDPFPQPSDNNPTGGDPFPQPSDNNPTGGDPFPQPSDRGGAGQETTGDQEDDRYRKAAKTMGDDGQDQNPGTGSGADTARVPVKTTTASFELTTDVCPDSRTR